MHTNTTDLCTFFTKSFKIYICEYISNSWLFIFISFIVFYKEENILILVKSNLSKSMFFCFCVLSKNCQRFSFMFSTRMFIILALKSRSWKFSINFIWLWLRFINFLFIFEFSYPNIPVTFVEKMIAFH